MPIAPAAYPPPFAASEVIAAPEAPADEQLEVGVAIVGGGPAGLACAIRLAQLLEADPAVAERLGETPIALVDKGRTVGAHQLSGAVVQPAPLLELFPGVSLEEMTSYGPVEREAVYLLTRSRAARLPIVPPPMHNKGNHVFSLARLARFMAERAEELGVMVLPETDAQRLLVTDGAVRGIRTGDKGRGRQGEELPTFEPGAELTAQATVLADGVQGMLSARGRRALRPAAREPADLRARGQGGVARRAPARARRAHDRLAAQGRVRATASSAARSPIRWAPTRSASGSSSASTTRTPRSRCTTCCRRRRATRSSAACSRAASASPGAPRRSPRAASGRCPRASLPPGAVILGDAAGFVNVPRLKGVHYALRSGMLAAETIHRALADGADLSQPGALSLYDAQVRNSEIYHDLRRYRNMRQAFQHGLIVGGALGGAMDSLHGDLPPWRLPTHPDAEQPVFVGKRTATASATAS